jgi:monoamine oxidase
VARTPIFAMLQRAYRLARYADRRTVPVDEVIERSRVSSVSRREFLMATGAATGAWSLAGCASLPIRLPHRRERDVQVIVVGAGLAGLTAAYRLRQAGVSVRVIEAQERVGGRCHSLRNHFGDGQVAELGGELIDSGHTQIRALAEEFRIPIDDLAEPDAGVGKELWYFDRTRYSERDVVDAFAGLARHIDADLQSIGGDGNVSYRTPLNAERLDRLTISQWLDQAGATGWFRRLLEVAYVTEYGLELEEQSALNLLLLMGPASQEFELFGASDERYHVKGGNDRIVSELASHVPDLVTGTQLEAIRNRADGAIELDVRTGGRAATISAPHVILALPFTLLRAVKIETELPPQKRLAIDQLGYGTNAKVMIGFDRRIWRTEYKSNGSVISDLAFQSIWETSRAQNGEGGILTNFTGGKHGVSVGDGPVGQQAGRVVGDLEDIFHLIANVRTPGRDVRFHWPSHPWSKGSYASYRPGQWTTLHGAEGERVRNLHFAGEHCSLEAQGFMEGAVETGQTAASEILADLGIAAPARTTRRNVPAGTGRLAWQRRHEVFA